MEKKKENPWEIDFIDKMLIFSDINNSSKFSAKNLNSTFQLASFSIHTSVKIYSERIDALHNFVIGFLNGLCNKEKKNKISSLKGHSLFEKKIRKTKLSLAGWKNLNSKKNIFFSSEKGKFFSSKLFFPEKNFIRSFKIKNFDSKTYYRPFLETLFSFVKFFAFFGEVPDFFLEKNLETRGKQLVFLKQIYPNLLFLKDKEQHLVGSQSGNLMETNFTPFCVIFNERRFSEKENLQEKNLKEENPLLKKEKKKNFLIKKKREVPENKEIFSIFSKTKEKEVFKKNHLLRKVMVLKNIKIPEINYWILKKKNIKKTPLYRKLEWGKEEKLNIFSRNKGKGDHIRFERNSCYPEEENTFGSYKEKGLSKDFKYIENFFSHSLLFSKIYPKANLRNLWDKFTTKKCILRFECFSLQKLHEKNSLYNSEVNLTKFVLFFLQLASENKIIFFGDINFKKIFCFFH